MFKGVPAKVLSIYSFENLQASPKSAILTVPLCKSILAGFRSLCMTLNWCMTEIPLRI